MVPALVAAILLQVGLGPSQPMAYDAFARQRVQVAEGVWLIHRPVPTEAPFEGNTIVFEQSQALVVIDAGGSPIAGKHIVEHIKSISSKPVKFLVYTHYHGDHNLGAGALLESWPDLVTISTEKTRANMTGPPMKYIASYDKSYAGMIEFGRERQKNLSLPASEREGWRRFVEAGPSMLSGYANLKVFPASLTFDDRLNLADDQMPLELRFLGRANTDGDLVVWAPKPRILVAGDIVVHPIPYASACYLEEWQAVLTRIRNFDFAQLVPGHGEIQKDREYLDRLIAVLGDVRAQVRPMVNKGMTLEAILKAVDRKALRSRFVTEEDGWGRFLINAVFIEDLIKNAYKEAKGEPIVQGGG